MINQAKWIWCTDHMGDNITCNFRKAFNLPKAATGSVLVGAHHFFRLYVNGREISGIASPAPTVFEKRRRLLSYDLSGYLTEGENVFAATVLYLGKEGQNHVRAMPCFLLEAEINIGGESLKVFTDESWQCSKSTAYAQGLPLRERRRLTGSTCFDGGYAHRDFIKPGFCADNWENAVISPAQLLPVNTVIQEIPEGGEKKRLSPSCIYKEENKMVFDTGEMLTGYVEVKLKGPKGHRLLLRYAELLKGQRRHFGREAEPQQVEFEPEHSASNDLTEHYTDQYILLGQGEECWEERFTYKAFRYFSLEGIKGAEILSVQAVKTGTMLPCLGSFSCEDSRVNAFASACLETQQNALLGLLVDCPHREQAQYLGDSLLQSHLLLYNFSGGDKMVIKVLRDFVDSQFADGHFPWVCPCDSLAGTEFDLRMPEYDFLFTNLMLRLYNYTGQIGDIAEFYPPAVGMMVHYLSLMDSRGLIPKNQETTIHISDWPYSKIDESGDYLFVENLYALRALKNLSELSGLLGAGDGPYWLKLYNKLKADIIRHFYNAEKGLFRDCPGSEKHSCGVNLLAVREGLFENRQAAIEKLLAMPMDTRVILSWDYLGLLFSIGEKQRAWDIITDPSNRWGLMIAMGSKIIWEGFGDTDSHSHAWNCYPLRLIQEYALGVSAALPGFEEIDIQPWFPKGISCMQGKVCTPKGVAELWFKLENGGLSCKLSLPKGTRGTLRWQGEAVKLESGSRSISLMGN